MSQQRQSECHPERPCYALGLCRPCYRRQDYHKNKEILRPKLRLRSKSYYRRNKAKIRAKRGCGTNSEWMKWMRRKRYGLTQKEFEKILQDQKGRCAICEEMLDVPSVDHNHVSGEVRGILCRRCNSALGNFRDDPLILSKAITYLSGGVIPSAPVVKEAVFDYDIPNQSFVTH